MSGTCGAQAWRRGAWTVLALAAVGGVGGVGGTALPAWAQGGPPPLPPPLNPPPVPPQNPITEAKRVLGKILFWEEQVSANNAMSCGTCHMPARGGTDPRLGAHPGPDAVAGNGDDRRASPGVPRTDGGLGYIRDAVFGTRAQVTPRSANSMVNAAYAPELFWDGRASSTFRDPLTGAVLIPAGGALESQAVGPPLSSVEMGHDGIDWTTVTTKLETARPLDLATNLPADVAAVLASNPGYPALFAAAFGDSTITPARIAFALATYQRTLVSDQTPFDRWLRGDNTALTVNQQQGFGAFTGPANCAVCHGGPLLTNQGFRNVGLRPPAEDLGRQEVTDQAGDRGRFKVPGLRNVALKSSFMHNGQFTNLTDVLRFYARAPGAAPQFPDNRDPQMNNINMPPAALAQVEDFLRNALTDPRVANETFPFDRPRLASEDPDRRVSLLGGASAGSGGVVPRMVVDMPPMLGTDGYRVGLDGALGGARARLVISTVPPVNGVVSPQWALAEVDAQGTGNGQGLATVRFDLTSDHFAAGQVVFVQWQVADAAAAGGVARSDVARLPVFCGSRGCAPAQGVDYNGDGVVNLDDLGDYITDFYTVPAVPAGVQVASALSGFALGYGGACATAGDAPTPYATDAYRAFGYRAAYSADGSNNCPLDASQSFPNLDHLGDYITAFYSAS
jgi:cytochrome c peroxidase